MMCYVYYKQTTADSTMNGHAGASLDSGVLFQAEDVIRDVERSRALGDVSKRPASPMVLRKPILVISTHPVKVHPFRGGIVGDDGECSDISVSHVGSRPELRR